MAPASGPRTGQLLIDAGRHLSRHADERAELLCRENGKPVRDGWQFDVNALIHPLSYFGSLADKMPGEMLDMGSWWPALSRSTGRPFMLASKSRRRLPPVI